MDRQQTRKPAAKPTAPVDASPAMDSSATAVMGEQQPGTGAATASLLLPERLVELLHGGNVLVVGTRSEKLMAHVCRAFGARVSPDRRAITVFLPKSFSTTPMANLHGNKQIALTVANPADHECYQFKGETTSEGPVSPDDQTVSDLYRTKLCAKLSRKYSNFERFFDHFQPGPLHAVTFVPREIYDQTPGPNAGRRVEMD